MKQEHHNGISGVPGGSTLNNHVVNSERNNSELDYLGKCLTEAVMRVDALEQSLRQVELENRSLEGTSSTFKIGNYNFHDLKDAKQFLAEAGAYGTTCGRFFDLFSLGNYCSRNDSERQLENRAMAMSAGMGKASSTEAAALLSFKMDRPPQFGFKKDVVRSSNAKEPTHILPNLKSMLDLYNPSSDKSVVVTILNGGTAVANSLNDLRTQSIKQPRTRGVYNMANEILHRMVTFMRELHADLDFFYRKVTSDEFAATEEEAWALISHTIDTILNEIFKARTEGYGIDVMDDEEECHAKALSSTFRAHAKMDKIRKLGFSKHPCVGPDLSHHIFNWKASISTIIEIRSELKEVVKRLQVVENFQAVSRSEIDRRFNEFQKEFESKLKATTAGMKKA